MSALTIGASLKLTSMAAVALALALTVHSLLSGDTIFSHYYLRYTSNLERSLKLLFLKGSPRRIALVQLLSIALALALGLGLRLPPAWYGIGIVVIAIAPSAYLARCRRQHVRRVESQIDSLIVGLANALKSVPSPAAALTQLVPVLPNPTRLEVERLLKEMRIGSTLEQGLVNMSARLGSRDLDSALSAVLIGLQVGGNLPLVLENTAATIREMNRLEGVVRTKTSEARAQLWVLAVFPFAIALGFNAIDPEYFLPLQATFVGTLVTAVAVLFWVASLLTARKILKVDI
jgi:tight adherence protein B